MHTGRCPELHAHRQVRREHRERLRERCVESSAEERSGGGFVIAAGKFGDASGLEMHS